MHLEKCSAHEDCILVDGEHTPKDADIGSKFTSWPPTQGEAERGVSDDALIAQFQMFTAKVVKSYERQNRLEERVNKLEGHIKRLATDERVSQSDKVLRQVASVVEKLVPEVTALTAGRVGLEGRADNLGARTEGLLHSMQGHVDTARREVAELKALHASTLGEARKMLAAAEQRAHAHSEVEELGRRIGRLENQVLHETQERAESHRKFMRSIQTVAELKG